MAGEGDSAPVLGDNDGEAAQQPATSQHHPLYVQNDEYWLHTLTKLSPLSGNHAHAHKVSGKFSLRVDTIHSGGED